LLSSLKIAILKKFRPFSPGEDVKNKLEQIRLQIQNLTPAQQTQHLNNISKILDGTAAAVQLKRPGTQKKRGPTIIEAQSNKKISHPVRKATLKSVQPPIQDSEPISNLEIYRNQLPNFIQPYLEDIKDVASDGNCGFRAAAHCLGRHEESFF
jgi:hypothetical protein